MRSRIAISIWLLVAHILAYLRESQRWVMVVNTALPVHIQLKSAPSMPLQSIKFAITYFS